MAVTTRGYFFSAFLLSVFGLLSFFEDESPEDSLDDESFDEAFVEDSPSDDEPEDAAARDDLLG